MELPGSRKPTTAGFGETKTIRSTIRQLDALDSETAAFLNALAFVLIRVADADRQVAAEERARIEQLLVEHANLTPAQAVLVAEIAKHRARLADCGCSYGESRHLRARLEEKNRQRVLDSLYAVAAADGRTSSTEQDEIAQIASEIGFTRGELGSSHNLQPDDA